MHIGVNVYYPLFFLYFRESEIWSFIIQIIHVRFLREYLPIITKLTLIPRIFFCILCLFSEIHFSLSIENINVC